MRSRWRAYRKFPGQSQERVYWLLAWRHVRRHGRDSGEPQFSDIPFYNLAAEAWRARRAAADVADVLGVEVDQVCTLIPRGSLP